MKSEVVRHASYCQFPYPMTSHHYQCFPLHYSCHITISLPFAPPPSHHPCAHPVSHHPCHTTRAPTPCHTTRAPRPVTPPVRPPLSHHPCAQPVRPPRVAVTPCRSHVSDAPDRGLLQWMYIVPAVLLLMVSGGSDPPQQGGGGGGGGGGR